MDCSMGVARVGKDHARPNTAAESTNCLSVVPLPGYFQVLSNRNLEIAVHSPAIELPKGIVALPSAIAREPYGEWMVGRGGAIDGNATGQRRDPRRLARSRYSALKRRRFLRKGIQDSALQN